MMSPEDAKRYNKWMSEIQASNGSTQIIQKNGTVRYEGAGNITDAVDNRPYIDPHSRPSYRNGVAEETFENAKVNGVVRDPYTNEVINWTPDQPSKGVWDMGHLPEHKYSEAHQRYLNREMTPQEFRDWFNTPENYRPELPSTNRSHIIE